MNQRILAGLISSILASVGQATAQVILSVDRLDGAEPGTPVPVNLVIVDVFADVAATDTWTAGAMRGIASSGAALVYGGPGPSFLVNPGLSNRFVTCLSKPLSRNDNARFNIAGAALAGRYSPAGATAVASASEVNVAWFASPPPTATSPSVDGYVARIALDISATTVNASTIVIATTPPSGFVTLFESTPFSGSAPTGTVSATLDFPTITGLNWGIYASVDADPSVTNGDFQIGSLAGWNVTNTPGGTGAPGVVANIDIDGPGPLGVSPAAKFAASQAAGQTGQEGVEMTQSIALVAGTSYVIEFDWSVQKATGTNVAGGGNFTFLVNGTSIVQASAGSTGPTLPRYGHVSAPFTPSVSGQANIGIRITRGSAPVADLFQYVDNVVIRRQQCYPNCDESTVPPTLTANDFQCFLNSFASADSYANCDGSTVPPTLTANDFQCFLNAFAAGCS